MNKNNDPRWMTDSEYRLVTEKTPIPTVDLVVLRQGSRVWETLLLIRKTGYASGKWCIIGGRQMIGEVAKQTIDRQAADVGVKVEVIPPFEPNFPAWIDDSPVQDKTKHSCSSVYPVRIVNGRVREEGEEYKGFKWFATDELPEMAYDHKFEILKVIEQLRKFGVKP